MQYFPKNDWYSILKDEFTKPYFIELQHKLKNEYRLHTIYPLQEHIYKAFELCSFNDTKVVILGQDPYHQPNQANGLSFSVSKEVDIPKSLKNIYKELENDLNIKTPTHGDLNCWAKQGVLLLNTFLTVKQNLPGSHREIGWELFTNQVISELNKKSDPIVFVLWGKQAQKKNVLVTNKNHLSIHSPHPSPLSAYRGFFNSKPFTTVNNFLIKHNQDPIDWEIK
ncbi:uracil-DNA glycosylase [Haloplasma contractile]|uniref:Uracil-DNA glycosylase n=1 Tax=Haloplasma contractile SSD-17B TaxID=1033810 RepID=U2EBN9_9MOLU|nr:uracil-DNA glycosylase [Haloplasma contractile]ERJ12483.1 Uracil-DNA glycosylase protein [Haloplasma contractile SSD-17B]